MKRPTRGKHLVRGGAIEVRGGDLAPARMAVAEFESMEQARALFALESFAEMRAQRSQFASANAFIVEGGPARLHERAGRCARGA